MTDPTPPNPAPAPAQPVSSVKYSSGDSSSGKGNGSGWILALTILQFLGAIVVFAMAAAKEDESKSSSVPVLITMLGLSAIFFGLWLWGRKSPFPALLTALIVYVTFHLLDAVFDPLTLLRGIILKVVIVSGLIAALRQAHRAKRWAELNSKSP